MKQGTSAQLRTKVQDLWNKRPHYVTPTLIAVVIILTTALIWSYIGMRSAFLVLPFLASGMLLRFKKISKKTFYRVFYSTTILLWTLVLYISIGSVLGKEISLKYKEIASLLNRHDNPSPAAPPIPPPPPTPTPAPAAKDPSSHPAVSQTTAPPNILPKDLQSTDDDSTTTSKADSIDAGTTASFKEIATDDPSRGVEATFGDLTIHIVSCKHMLNTAIQCMGRAENNSTISQELAFKEGGSALDDLGNTDDLPLRRNGITFGLTGTVQMPPNTHAYLRLQFKDESLGRSSGLQSITLHARWNGVYGNITLPAIPIS